MDTSHDARANPLLEDDMKSKKAITSWRSLFNSRDQIHLFALAAALLLSALSGVLLPAVAILMGKYFDAPTKFGAGTISDRELSQRVLASTHGLIAIGGATWLLKGGCFTFWLVLGEMKAKNVPDKLFQSLLLKDLE